MAGYAMGETANRNEREIRVGGARTYRGQHRYDGDLGGTSGFPVKLGLHTIPTLDPLMNHIPSGRLAPPTGIRYSSDICQSSIGAQVNAEKMPLRYWKVEVEAKVQSGSEPRLTSALTLTSACLAHHPTLCVAAVFGLFKLVDELLEFIEFVWSDVLKGDSEFISSNQLHTCVFD